MSDSLAGGLLPLGKYSASGSVEGSSLSGGLIPLGGSSKSGKATAVGGFGRLGLDQPSHDDEASTWDKDKNGRKDRRASGLKTERESKKKRSSTRHDSTRKSGKSKTKDGGHSSREGRHARVPGTVDGDDHSKDTSESRATSSSFLAAAELEDDSYLLGTTATAKGRKGGGSSAEAAAALLLNSDDIFGLAKSRGVGRVSEPPPPKGNAQSRTDRGNRSTGSGGVDVTRVDEPHGEHDGKEKSSLLKPPEASVNDTRSRVAGMQTGKPPGESLVHPPSGTSIDNFDSSDETDSFLRLTDPSKLVDGSNPAVPPIPIPNFSKAHVLGGRANILSLPPSDQTDGREGAVDQRRVPSPPSSPRREGPVSPEHSPIRPGRSLNRGTTAEDGMGVATEPLGRAARGKHGLGAGISRASDTGVAAGPVVKGAEALSASAEREETRPSHDAASLSGAKSTGEGRRRGAEVLGSTPRSPSETTYTTVSGDPTERDGDGGAGKPSTQIRSGNIAAQSAGVPRKSALAREGMPRSRDKIRSRGVKFDDDLIGVDALDILPSSDDDVGPPDSSNHDSPVPIQASAPIILATDHHSASPDSATSPSLLSSSGKHHSSESRPAVPAMENRRGSHSITEGLSPAAARLMAEDSSDEGNVPTSTAESLGLFDERGATTGGTGAWVGLEPDGAKLGGDVTDNAKLDFVLGFTPSTAESGRKPRRTLPTGGRRRPRAGNSPPTGPSQMKGASQGAAAAAAANNEPHSAAIKGISFTNGASSPAPNVEKGQHAARGVEKLATGPGSGVRRGSLKQGDSLVPDRVRVPAGASHDIELSLLASAAITQMTPATTASSTAVPSSVTPSGQVIEPAIATARASGDSSGSPVAFSSLSPISSTHRTQRRSDSGASSQGDATFPGAEAGPTVVASLEQQLSLSATERDGATARLAQHQERTARDAEAARAASTAANARAFEAASALLAARARIQQLESEAAEHASRVARLEYRAASDVRAEQESCIAKISAAQTRHQGELSAAEEDHREALRELKRQHRDDVEGNRQKIADSTMLQALAGQVQSSAGAVKLLQAELVERKGVDERSREEHMNARERLIKELEQSARRAQQTAEDEVQRLQGTLMAMDQVMRGLRGQNAGERERLRQEHLRMEALQGSMVAEVEAVRQSVDEERQRLAKRCAELDSEKRQAGAAARQENERLIEQRFKLDKDRESFASLQVSASQAAEDMARRYADEEESLKVARQSLEREASSFEARLMAARADLQKADDVRSSLERSRDEDERERRRLKSMAGELERAFDEVRSRAADIDHRGREAEEARTDAIEAAKQAKKEQELTRLRTIQIEEVAQRQDAERTSIAQARAQSATELSTSRRLKAELSRAFAVQQRHASRTLDKPSSMPHLAVARGDWYGGGDLSAGTGIGSSHRDHRGTKVDPAVHTSGRNTAGPRVLDGMIKMGGDVPAPPDNAAGLPFTGIAAAEATLHAVSSAPPFPGLDVGKELGRLAQREADLRECTREQSAFLSSSRAARFNTGHMAPDSMFTTEKRSDSPSFSKTVSPLFDVLENQSEPLMSIFGPEDWANGVRSDVQGLGVAISSTLLDELEEIERACDKRSMALVEEEQFVETCGKTSSPCAN